MERIPKQKKSSGVVEQFIPMLPKEGCDESEAIDYLIYNLSDLFYTHNVIWRIDSVNLSRLEISVKEISPQIMDILYDLIPVIQIPLEVVIESLNDGIVIDVGKNSVDIFNRFDYRDEVYTIPVEDL